LNALCSVQGAALIVDEVFFDFAHGVMPPPMSLPRSERPAGDSALTALKFTLSGLSKISGLPQMKFAWIAASGPDDQVREAMARLEVIADTYLSMNAPVQLAAPAFFAQRHDFQRQLMERIRANLAELDRQLAAQQICERLKIEGGWYAVLRVPVTRSDEDLAIGLMEQHSVLVHPGHFYNFPSDGYLVVSLIAPEEEFRGGVQRLLTYIAE
jgi:alanine-synthesizing transaminase